MKNWKTKLDGTGRQILRHLETYQPNRLKHLKQTNQLPQYVLNMQEMAFRYLQQAGDAGRPIEETLEIIREMFVSLPDLDFEKDHQSPPGPDIPIG